MKEIIPAILEKELRKVKEKLEILRGRVKCVHLDIEDGRYVPNATWPFTTGGFEDADFEKIMNEEEGLPYWQEFDYELDLMVQNAVEDFDTYMRLGPKRIIFHLGAQTNLEEFEHFLEGLDMYTRENVEIGIAFKPNENIDVVARLSEKVDFLHAMGSDKVGFQGEPFHEKALENIKTLKEKLPGVIISVDIGVNLDNAREILNAGADRLAVGSAIWKSVDAIGTLEELQSLL